jgi:hypothetical protein
MTVVIWSVPPSGPPLVPPRPQSAPPWHGAVMARLRLASILALFMAFSGAWATPACRGVDASGRVDRLAGRRPRTARGPWNRSRNPIDGFPPCPEGSG